MKGTMEALLIPTMRDAEISTTDSAYNFVFHKVSKSNPFLATNLTQLL